MRLVNAIYHLGENKIVAHVAHDGIVRDIQVKWWSKHVGLPRDWDKCAFGEVEFAVTEEAKRAAGRPTL